MSISKVSLNKDILISKYKSDGISAVQTYLMSDRIFYMNSNLEIEDFFHILVYENNIVLAEQTINKWIVEYGTK